ncbi:aldehyde dehydrogenase family protein, partial [Gammaproteobacteria bacterium]|nr:aldehyde dehydrogenase family protein [Gammaproteobacteria bacterium]
ADSDLDKAVKATVSGSFWASGQNCIGTQRIFVERSIFDKFLSAFVEQTKALNVGDPMNESTDVGPMITPEQSMRIQSWEDARTLRKISYSPLTMKQDFISGTLSAYSITSLFRIRSLRKTIIDATTDSLSVKPSPKIAV